MFFELIGKEIKQQFKSITFYLFIIILIFSYHTQFIGDLPDSIKPTPPNKENGYNNYYGYTYDVSHMEEMKSVYSSLYRDYKNKETLIHGTVMNKTVKLSQEQIDFLKKTMKKISIDGYQEKGLKIDITYEDYLDLMEEVDKKLGGDTYYDSEYRYMITRKRLSYEEALENFNILMEKDKLTRGYGRLFADYMGITAGIYLIFLSAFVITRDKRSKMDGLIYSRKISSFKYILAKYIGLFVSVFIGYIVVATHATIMFTKIASINNYTIDYFAFYKYTIIWIVPTILFTLSIGFIISIVFGNGIVAIPFQFILFSRSVLPLSGDYGLDKFMIRFNSSGKYEQYIQWRPQIITNRIFYVILSIAILIISVLVFEWKRGRGDEFFTIKKRTG
ncbi:ABC transporter permease [Dethiothermospora halolimnae]|uniref:ABC transporter permease n=1 Tax=Dethiothermospora halolimnae TaxID=3114390 RepID=UPI003CCBA54D